MKCAICGRDMLGNGCDPKPVLSSERRVCDACNLRHIIPVRRGANQVITTYDGGVINCSYDGVFVRVAE